MEPFSIAIYAVFILFVYFKTYTHLTARPKKKPNALEPWMQKLSDKRKATSPASLLEIRATYTVEQCAEWDQRNWERKLVEAGMMDELDMTMCDNSMYCPNCHPQRSKMLKIHRKEAEEKRAAFEKMANEVREAKSLLTRNENRMANGVRLGRGVSACAICVGPIKAEYYEEGQEKAVAEFTLLHSQAPAIETRRVKR